MSMRSPKTLTKKEELAEMLDEATFKRMLLLERRRCERAGTRFALLLIDMEDLSRSVDTAVIERNNSHVSVYTLPRYMRTS